MKKNKRKLNYIKILEAVIITILNIEIFYITYSNALSFKKTLIIALSIAMTIKLLKKEN